MRRYVLAAGFVLVGVAPAAAQLQSQLVVSGLSSPVAFVQDPALADTQYVVEQGGRIRVVRNGQLLATDFLDLRAAISSGGERGLLGLAFTPDYASSGRCFVNFTNPSGQTVIARFLRSSTDARRADASTRVDLRWPDGNRFITQPYSNHNGGNLQFGPDGYLYIGLGDGGSGDDPQNLAQTPSTLLGKMLRIDVDVPESDAEGYDVPPDNPFVGRAGYLAEIWAFGLRNPWRYGFDAFGTDATGALIIGDVGQNRYEEIDYEPANRGGRNYGWRYREGAHDEVTSLPPAYLPLIDPIHEYGRTVGQTVIGGYVYRGASLPSSYRGRYFFADYVTPRVWSIALSIDGSGEATASGLQEHTAELGGASTFGRVSSFGIDANGELYLVGHSKGEIRRIVSAAPSSQAIMTLDAPAAGDVVQPFSTTGWAIDLAQSDSTTGVDTVHVWAIPMDGRAPIFLGASYGGARPDVATAYGGTYRNSGFSVSVSGLAEGTYQLSASARSTVTNQFEATGKVQVSIVGGPAMGIDAPLAGATVPARFSMSGWAVDRDSLSGTGVDAIDVWAYPPAGAPRFVGAAVYGSSRADIAALWGSRFTNSGWTMTGNGLAPGQWTLVVSAHSTVTGTFRLSSSVTIDVQSGTTLHVDTPQASSLTTLFQIEGWAVDLAASSGAGISAVHAWAFPVTGGSAVFVGAASLGGSRPDIGALYGSPFTPSGFQVTASSLPAGTYDLTVYAQSAVTGTFDAVQVVRIVITSLPASRRRRAVP